jgi:hypothetical protein
VGWVVGCIPLTRIIIRSNVHIHRARVSLLVDSDI